MKKIIIILIISFMCIMASGCNKHDIIFYDFTNGINPETWTIIHKKWGKNNGGVVYENVGYTADGNLVLNAHGDYYTGNVLGFKSDHGRRAGAAICTKKALGPGSYTVRAKIMPRFGACCAFWTYSLINEINSEIDIEFGIKNDFSNIMFTNWLTEKNYANKKLQLADYQNDGDWHTYRFDWYTFPTKKIDYFVDGKLLYTATSHIPEYDAHFWIGVWFPDKWAGEPNFDSDFMLVDWFKYERFANNNYFKATPDKTCPTSYYPSKPQKPIRNLISNSSLKDNIGWKIEGEVLSNSNNFRIINGVVKQSFDYFSPNLNYYLSFNYHGTIDQIIIECFDKKHKLIDNIKIIDKKLITTNITEFNKNIQLLPETDSFTLAIQGSNVTIQDLVLDFTK